MKQTLLLAGILLCFSARAADFQTWAAGIVNHALSDNWVGYYEIQNRLHQDSSTEQRLLVRPALGYRIGDHHTFYLGYGWTPLFSPAFKDEHRLWQQSLVKYTWGKCLLQFRFRLEQRWIGSDTETAWRWREFIRGQFSFDGWNLVLWDEFFFALNATANVPQKGFDQNRFFIGAGLPITPELIVEPGYLNLVTRTPAGTTLANVIAVYLYWNPT